jgi:hypothetical protein
MTAGDYVAAAVLIALILLGVKGVLTQDKFRLLLRPNFVRRRALGL